MIKAKKTLAAVSACLMFAAYTHAQAAEVTVKMLNQGPEGQIMAFDPALVRINPGDSVHFVATDKGHNIESTKGMIPEGAQPFAGKMNEDLTVTLDKPGVYGVDCKPHYPMGMVALIVVGKPVNEEAAKASLSSGVPNLAKNNFTKLFAKLDAK